MAIAHTKTEQGLTVSTGTGSPTHTAVAGDRYTDTSNGNTYQYTTSWQIISYGAGGLTYFSESQNTTTPNVTIPVDSLIAVTSTTNGDVAIVPKGAGAFSLAVADNLVTGGNKRGQYAVDLQLARSTSGQVAGGVGSFTAGSLNSVSQDYGVAIGRQNSVTSYYGTALGLQNSVTGSYATALGMANTSSGQNGFAGGYGSTASGGFSIAIGNGNIASNTGSVSLGQGNNVSGISGFSAGNSNVNSGSYSAVFGQSNAISGQWTLRSGYGNGGNASYSITSGYNNVVNGSENGCFGSSSNVTGDYAFSLGYQNVASGYASTSIGQKANTFGISGRKVFSSGGYVTGDSQKSILNLRIRTTNATPTVLTSDAGVAGTTNQLILQDNNSIRFKGTIIGRQSGSTNTSAWDIDGIIQRGVGVATTTLLISNVNSVLNLNLWGNPTLVADTTNGGLSVNVIGLATTNIQWTCALDTTEVIYA